MVFLYAAQLALFQHFGVRPKSGIFEKKTLKRMWVEQEFLWSGKCYRPSQKLKRRGKSCGLHLKKNFWLGGCGFFVSDVLSGGLLGHLGPLCLALGANR